MNYGHKYTEGLTLSSFLFFEAAKLTLTITNMSFGYNMAFGSGTTGSIIYLEKFK